MRRRLKHWILLANHHESDTWILTEGDTRRYEIVPNNEVKKGDIIYLWWLPHNCFYGWGEVAETPQTTIVEKIRPEGDIEKKLRQNVVVNRKKGFRRFITAQMMLADRNLKKFIPTGFDDFYAVPLQEVRAGYLNDYIREHDLEAPQGSATISWFVEEIPPQITLQALITAGDKVKEGQLVEGVSITWFEMIKMISRNPEELYKMDPRKFEELIAAAYERAGYDEVILTPRSGDLGRDVIATKNGIGSIRIFDQIKRNRITHPVTADDVRALAGVISMAQNVSKGVITTSGVFAPNLEKDEFISRLLPYRLELRPRDILIPWLKKLGER